MFGIQPDCAITRHKATVNALSKHKASLHVFRLKKARDFMQQEKMFTVEDIMRQFQVSKRTVQRWLENGELDSIKIGRLRRIPESALDRFLANLKDRNKPTR